MSNYPNDQECSPPELPPYLKSVYDLKPILGGPSDEEVMGIHAVIRVAKKVVDLQDMGDPALLARLAEHLFNAQMARYRSKYPCTIFSTSITYTPPALPVHISANLEPVSGSPSVEEVTKVQNAIRSYQKLTDIPSLFDPQVNAELSQHLFDLQMARYMTHHTQANPIPRTTDPTGPNDSANSTRRMNEETNTSTNNSGSGVNPIEAHQPPECVPSVDIRAVLERSNQLAERSNQLIEQSNQITEQLTRVVERSNQAADQPNELAQKLTEFFGIMKGHLAQSNRIAEASSKPVEKIGDTLKTINKVLVGIQHAIVRNKKGNTSSAVDCLVNEVGDTLGMGDRPTFNYISNFWSTVPEFQLPVVVDGVSQSFHIPNNPLGIFLHFFGISAGLCEGQHGFSLIQGKEHDAREKLSAYLSCCLG